MIKNKQPIPGTVFLWFFDDPCDPNLSVVSEIFDNFEKLAKHGFVTTSKEKINMTLGLTREQREFPQNISFTEAGENIIHKSYRRKTIQRFFEDCGLPGRESLEIFD